jgi:hypothetical protein
LSRKTSDTILRTWLQRSRRAMPIGSRLMIRSIQSSK